MQNQTGQIRLGELLGALSYALDITEGQPEGHSVRCCWLGMQIADEIGLSKPRQTDLYFTLLLKDLGCSANSAKVCALFRTNEIELKRGFKLLDGSPKNGLQFVLKHAGRAQGLKHKIGGTFDVLRKTGSLVNEMVDTRCHRGAEIAAMMRFNADVSKGIEGLDEHWDGGGQPYGLIGEDIPLYARIALLTQVVDVFHEELGPIGAEMEVGLRRGRWFDPTLVDAFLNCSKRSGFWEALSSESLAEHVFDSDPAHSSWSVDDNYLDEIALAFSKVIDAKSPFTHGHSERVSQYTDLICVERGYSDNHRRWMKRASLLHDIGKLGVSNTVLDKPGKLTDMEFAMIKSHATLTQEILSRIDIFRAMAVIASAHHEKLDGTGYPKGLKATDLSEDMRILAVADIFDALTAERPYKAALPLEKVYEIMDDMAGTGIDPDCYRSLQQAISGQDHCIALKTA